MVNTSNSRSGGPGFTSLTRHVVSLDKELYSTLSIFTQVYKWVPTSYCWGGGGGNPAMHWHAVQRGEAKLQGMLHAKETGLSSGHFGLWLLCAFTFTCCQRKFFAPKSHIMYFRSSEYKGSYDPINSNKRRRKIDFSSFQTFTRLIQVAPFRKRMDYGWS